MYIFMTPKYVCIPRIIRTVSECPGTTGNIPVLLPHDDRQDYIVDDAAHCPQLHVPMPFQNSLQTLPVKHLI